MTIEDIMIICLICAFLCTSISATDPSDFSLKGDPCSKFDSCYSKPTLRTCSCDNNCHSYGTCCSDFKKSHQDVPVAFHCYSRRTSFPVFVKRSCSDDFHGHIDNRRACFDNDEDEMDVKNNLLVTSHRTKVTYWNKHCARCNNEAEDDLENWNIEVFCPSHKDVDSSLIRRNLTFDQDKRQWGLIIGDDFLKCIVKYAPSPYIDEVKQCTANLISSCPMNYTDEDIAIKCSQYYAERKTRNSNVFYKNIHCAICNGVNVRDLDCPGIAPEDNIENDERRGMLEEIFTKGDWLDKEPGKMYECSEGFSYDPARKKCRRDLSLIQVPTGIPNSSHTFKEQYFAILVILFTFMY